MDILKFINFFERLKISKFVSLNMKNTGVTFLFIMLITLCSAQNETGISVVGPAEFQEQIQQGNVQVVDVRTALEFEKGHINGAVNIDFYAEDFLKNFSEIDKNEPLYIYCKSGNRSGEASKRLRAIGFKKIVDLKGGYLSWKKFVKK